MSERLAQWCAAHLPALVGRRYLVTGAASGLGLETATGLALQGADVVLADRNVEAGQRAARQLAALAPAVSIEFRALDLADLAGVRGFASALLVEGRPLDGLVNNAGILPPLQRRTTEEGFELKFGVNVLGHYALTGLLLPRLRQSAAARVVWVSSLVHKRAQIAFDDLHSTRDYDPQRTYNQAKLACLMLALELDDRARHACLPLASIAAHPGIARTLLGDSRKGQARRGLRDHATDVAFWIAMRLLSQPQGRGARSILYAVAAEGASGGGFYGPDGFAEMRGDPKPVMVSKPARDAAQRRRLWQACEQLTGIAYDL